MIDAQCVQRIQSGVSACAAAGWDAVSIATKVIAIWRDVETALSPIIGHRGVAALFARSLHLTGCDFPWLTTAHEVMAEPIDFAALQSTLSRRSSADVVALNDALLQKFAELLANLIGASLAERLFRPVVDIHSTGDAVARGGAHDA